MVLRKAHFPFSASLARCSSSATCVVFLDLRVASRLRCNFRCLIARCSAFVPTIGLLGVGPSLDGGKDEALGRACRKGMGVNTAVPKAIGAIGRPCLPLEEA